MLLMSSFILIQQMEMGNSSISALPSSEQYSFQDQCPNHLKQKIYEEMPHCAPRDTLVNLPVPYSSDIVEVIPHQVIAQRCQGVCAQGNEHHQCVPNQLGRTNKRFEVLLRDQNGNYKCGETQVEFHDSCKCGCDVDSARCSQLQMYDHRYCRCFCRDIRAKMECLRYESEQKFWDESSCRCICRAELVRECTTGFVYDGLDTCSCVPGSSPKAAGIEVVGSLIAVIVVLILAIVLLSWRYRKLFLSRRNQEPENPPVTSSTPFRSKDIDST